jgi:hypothetical protein
MKGILMRFLIVLAALSMATPAVAQDKSNPPEFISLVEGIVGGIVAPHQKLHILIIRKSATSYEVWVWSQPAWKDKVTVTRSDLAGVHLKKLWKDLEEEKPWKLPVESPRGGEDIYIRDTGIHLHQRTRCWRNSGPSGCGHMESKVHPTEAQKTRFDKLIALIKKAAVKDGMIEATEGEFKTRYLSLLKLHCK